MEILYEWIKDIAIYMLLVSVIVNLLPKNHYEKYVRLFTGMVMIILMIKPLSSFLNLQEQLDTFFSLDIYKQELRDVNMDFQEISNTYEDQMMEGYKEQIQSQLGLLLQEEGKSLEHVEFELCMEEGENNYGRIQSMKVYLTQEAWIEEENISVPSVESPFARTYEDLSNSRIREKICEYYQLEKEQVEIYE